MAEREGFEPSERVSVHTISKRYRTTFREEISRRHAPCERIRENYCTLVENERRTYK